MHCDQFETRLNDLLDRRISPDDDATLCAHAQRCPACADSMAAYLSLTTAIQKLPPDSPDETFRFAVMNRMAEEQSVSIHRQRRQWLMASLVTAATVLIALTLWRGGIDPNSSAGTAGGVATDLPPGYERLAEETQQLASLIATRQLEVMNELAEGIKPVTTSFSAAYDALRRTLPANNTEGTSG